MKRGVQENWYKYWGDHGERTGLENDFMHRFEPNYYTTDFEKGNNQQATFQVTE